MDIIHLSDNGNVKLFCPFCGKIVVNPDKQSQECEHTLFIATIEGGFEHISPKISINENYDSDEEITLDEYIETLEHPESVCFEIAQFSGFSAFIGFGRGK